MTISFNLIDEPWIPCIRLNGKRDDELSLRAVFAQADRLQEIRGDSPLETASLYRLLLAVLHWVCGPKDFPAWIELWERRSFDSDEFERHFAECRRQFDLFDSIHPFFQVADETDLGTRSNFNKMVHHISSGNTATLFEHTSDTKQSGVQRSPAQAARDLITTQYFGLGYQNFVDAPCTKGVICFIQGDCLFETLVLNTYPDNVIANVIPKDSRDQPAWESKDPFQLARTKPFGRLDYLTWHNRKIKLFPRQTEYGILVDQVAWAPGLRLDDNVTDPMQRYWKSDTGGWRELIFTPERILWRDSAVLFDLSADTDKVRPIAALNWISRVAGTKPHLLRKIYRLAAYGMSKDKGKIRFFRSELMPLPVQYLHDTGLIGKLSGALEMAEQSEHQVSIATFNLARLILNPTTTDDELAEEKTKAKMKQTHGNTNDDEAKRIKRLTDSWGTERYFWSGLELHFHRLIQDLPVNPQTALKEWRQRLRRTARGSFDQAEAYVGADNRTQRAMVKARNQFEYSLKRILQEPSEIQSENGGEEQ